MSRSASAIAAAPDWRQAVSLCLERLGPAPSGANLGFVYASDLFAGDLAEVVTELIDRTGVPHWAGSVGMGVCGRGAEHHEEGAISVLVLTLPPDSFRTFDVASADLGAFRARHGDWIARTGARFAVVHGDPRNPELPRMIEGLSEALDGGFLVGGLTSSRGPQAQVAGGITEGGLSGVLFSAGVAVATSLTQSCAPFGAEHEITECQRNILVSLDGRPALDVFREEIGEILARNLGQAARTVAAALPVPGSDTGDYLVRNVIGIDPGSRMIAIGEALERGGRIRFCKRDPRNALEDMHRMLASLRERVPAKPAGAVYFSCVGRGVHMFGEDAEEMKAIGEAFGALPVAGFFCNGEISHTRLYGYTGVLAVFS